MSNKKLSKPRFIQAFYAFINGYFWLPCPLCGKYFGGHETAKDDLYIGWGKGRCVCKECGEEAERRSIPIYKKESEGRC